MIAAPRAPQEQAPKEYKYNKSDELDQKIAVGLAASQILSQEGSQVVLKALSSGNPPKMIAMFLAQVIEQAMTMSISTDIPMTPVVWLANGGAVDELGEIFQAVADKNGIEVDAEGMMPAVKQELAAVLKQRGGQLQGQMEQEQQGPPQEQPMDPGQAPTQPMIGAPRQ